MIYTLINNKDSTLRSITLCSSATTSQRGLCQHREEAMHSFHIPNTHNKTNVIASAKHPFSVESILISHSKGEEWKHLRSSASKQIVPRRVANYAPGLCEMEMTL